MSPPTQIARQVETMVVENEIQTWSTEAVPQHVRLDFWMSTLDSQLWPVTEWSSVVRNFGVELREASLGCLSTMSLSISAHDSNRVARDIDRSLEACYLLVLNRDAAWGSTHNGHCEWLQPDDIVLWSNRELQTHIPHGLRGAILKCPAHWLRTWVPDPDLLVGRRIARESTWGRVLSPILGQVTPELALAPPLPSGVLVDQLGALLALMAGDEQSRPAPDLRKRALASIRERCSEPQLTAADVAASLGVSVRKLHRALAQRNLTFAAALMDARMEVARGIIGSRVLTPGEITETASQAGFLDAGHFLRVLRRRGGGRSPHLQKRDPAGSEAASAALHSRRRRHP